MNKYQDSEYSTIISRLDIMDGKLDKLHEIFSKKHILEDGDTLLDNQDMCLLLGVSKRTLQRYRQHKLIPYYIIRRKTFYKKSEIMEFCKGFTKSTHYRNLREL